MCNAYIFIPLPSKRLIDFRRIIFIEEMKSMDHEGNKRKEIVNICLDKFISKGLAETTSRDLSTALKLQSGGLYYYFSAKDDAVIACAGEAAARLENELMLPVLNDLCDPERLFANLRQNAEKMAPTMKFFTQVCAAPKYFSEMIPVLERLEERRSQFFGILAQRLNRDLQEIRPLADLCITAVVNYMIFGGEACIRQLDSAKVKLIELTNEHAYE